MKKKLRYKRSSFISKFLGSRKSLDTKEAPSYLSFVGQNDRKSLDTNEGEPGAPGQRKAPLYLSFLGHNVRKKLRYKRSSFVFKFFGSKCWKSLDTNEAPFSHAKTKEIQWSAARSQKNSQK